MSSNNAAITIKDLSKTYRLYNRPADRLLQGITRKPRYNEIHALRNISLNINHGETVGIVGSNGSGKSTLLQIICGTVQQSGGECDVNGRISALLELGAGFNPEFTGVENIYLNGAILGMSRDEIKEKYSAITDFADIGNMVNQPVKTYSSGMYIRLAFAVAIASDPDILVVDEALAVGDEAFQRKCFARIQAIQESGGTILFVSHSAHTIVDICDRAILLDHGELLSLGKPKTIISHYHKLIYAPKDTIASLRDSLKKSLIGQLHNPLNDSSTEEGDNAAAEIEELPVFDPTLVPESQVSFEPNGAVIAHPQILTMDKRPANLLQRGERYTYTYDVHFDKEAHKVRFGMMIKTKSGVLLGGASSHALNDLIETIKNDKHISVAFTFTCLLLPGTYFTNSGCTSMVDGSRVFLHRITDALMFKVLPEKENMLNGTVDFQIESSVAHL